MEISEYFKKLDENNKRIRQLLEDSRKAIEKTKKLIEENQLKTKE